MNKWVIVADRLAALNVIWYILLATMYLLGGHFPKVLYFGGAAILALGVYLMK